MFGMKFYSNEELKEDSSDMFIINGENESTTEDDKSNIDLKQEFFNGSFKSVYENTFLPLPDVFQFCSTELLTR